MPHPSLPVLPKTWLRPYLWVLGLAALGCFGSLSAWDVNPWLKIYGLSVGLQGSFALVYLIYQLGRSRRKHSPSPPQDPFQP